LTAARILTARDAGSPSQRAEVARIWNTLNLDFLLSHRTRETTVRSGLTQPVLGIFLLQCPGFFRSH